MRIKPKKSLGQNFLTDGNIRRKIIASCNFDQDDIVLEIGSGRGEMTRLLAAEAKKVFAVEVDKRLFEVLDDNLKDLENVEIIKKDFLKLGLENLLKSEEKKMKVFGNIPYYITTPIISRLFEFHDKIDTVYLTVQKEFARRITAEAGSKDYGSFSCFVRYHTRPSIIFDIKKNSFTPAPKVDSSFLKLEFRKKHFSDKKSEEILFSIIRAAFGKRRKVMRNSLKELIPVHVLDKFFLDNRLNPDTRPEKLALGHFISLTELFLKKS